MKGLWSLLPGSAAPGIVAPGIVAPGIVAPGIVVPGIVAPGIVAPGIVVPGIVAPGNVALESPPPGLVAALVAATAEILAEAAPAFELEPGIQDQTPLRHRCSGTAPGS